MEVDEQLTMHDHLCVASEASYASLVAGPQQATTVPRLQQGVTPAETRIASTNLNQQLQALELGTSASEAITEVPTIQAGCNAAKTASCSTRMASSTATPDMANTAVNQSNCMRMPATASTQAPSDSPCMLSQQPALTTSSATEHSSKHEHESAPSQQQLGTPTTASAYELPSAALLVTSQSPGISMDADAGYSAVDLFSMISDKGSPGNDSPVAFLSPLISLQDHAMCSVQAATSGPVPQQHDVHRMHTSAMCEPERQQGDTELPTAAVVASLQAADLEAAAATRGGSHHRQSTAAPLYATAGQTHGRSDDEEVECSKRRLSAGTERRVHVAEQLRQMLQEAPKLLSNPSDIVSPTSLCIAMAGRPSQFRPQKFYQLSP